MRNISLRSLMLAEELSHIKNEVELIHPQNDELVFSVLEQIGFDTKRGVEYIPSYHRDMSGKAAVGFQAVGEYNTDPKYRDFLDTTDRIVVAGMVDISLAKDMADLMGKRYPYRNDDEGEFKARKRPNDPRYYSDAELIEMGYTDGSEEEEAEEQPEIESNYESVVSQISALEEVKKMLRGAM